MPPSRQDLLARLERLAPADPATNFNGVPCRPYMGAHGIDIGGARYNGIYRLACAAAGIELPAGARLAPLCSTRHCGEIAHIGGLPEVIKDPDSPGNFVPASVWISNLKEMAKVRYFLTESVEPGGLTIICGHPKTGKSLLAMDMMLAMSTGVGVGPWVTEEGPLNVGYIDLDGPEAGTQHRLEAFSAYRGIAVPDALKIYNRRRFQLLEPGALESLMESIQRTELSVLVIDTMFRSYGGDENSSKDLGKYIEGLVEIMDLGVAVVLIHHLRKPPSEGYRSSDFDPQEGLRGSSALASVYDHIVSLQKGRVKAIGKEPVTIAIQQGKQVKQTWFRVQIPEEADHLIYGARQTEASEWIVGGRK